MVSSVRWRRTPRPASSSRCRPGPSRHDPRGGSWGSWILTCQLPGLVSRARADRPRHVPRWLPSGLVGDVTGTSSVGKVASVRSSPEVPAASVALGGRGGAAPDPRWLVLSTVDGTRHPARSDTWCRLPGCGWNRLPGPARSVRTVPTGVGTADRPVRSGHGGVTERCCFRSRRRPTFMTPHGRRGLVGPLDPVPPGPG